MAERLEPYTVRAKETFGGGRVTFNQHDDLLSAEVEAGQVANGGWTDFQHLDGVWIEDVGGEVVWSVGAPPYSATPPPLHESMSRDGEAPPWP